MWHGSLWVPAKHRTSRLSIRSWLAPKYNPADEKTGIRASTSPVFRKSVWSCFLRSLLRVCHHKL